MCIYSLLLLLCRPRCVPAENLCRRWTPLQFPDTFPVTNANHLVVGMRSANISESRRLRTCVSFKISRKTVRNNRARERICGNNAKYDNIDMEIIFESHVRDNNCAIINTVRQISSRICVFNFYTLFFFFYIVDIYSKRTFYVGN